MTDTIAYAPPTNIGLVRYALEAAHAVYGCYPWSNAVLAAATDLTPYEVHNALMKLAQNGEWVPHRGQIALLADPRLDGRELRRFGVLVRGAVQ